MTSLIQIQINFFAKKYKSNCTIDFYPISNTARLKIKLNKVISVIVIPSNAAFYLSRSYNAYLDDLLENDCSLFNYIVMCGFYVIIYLIMVHDPF